METQHTAASTYVQISREELEDWLDDAGFRGKWERDARYAGVYLLALSDSVAIKLSSTIGSKDDAMGRGQASMQLALISRINGRVLNKKAQGQSHFARTKGWMRNWAAGLDTMKRAYQMASDFYDVIAVIDDRDKYRTDTLKQIEEVPNWGTNNFFIGLHRKVDRGGVLMPNETREITKAMAVPVMKVAPPAAEEVGPQDAADEEIREEIQAEQQVQSLRELWRKAERYSPRDERDEKNKTWVLDFVKSIGTQLKGGRTLSPAQITVVRRNLDQWDIKLPSGKPASTLF